MDEKEFKKFCNNLRCPICQSQLDGNLNSKKANLYCVSQQNEYVCWLFPSLDSLNVETAIMNFGNSEYYLLCNWTWDKTKAITFLYKTNIDLALKFRYNLNNCKKILDLPQRVTHLASLKDEKIFLNKVKLYNTFS